MSFSLKDLISPARRTDIADPLVRRLQAIEWESPELAEAARLYKAILPLIRDARVSAAAVGISAEAARSKMKQGLPLLRGLDVEIDFQGVSDLIVELARAVESAGNNDRAAIRLPWAKHREIYGLAAEALRIRLAFERKEPDIEVLRSFIATDDKNQIQFAADDLKLLPGLLSLLVRNAFLPALRALRAELDPLIQGAEWRKYTCYLCGAPAVFAELQDNAQVRHLRCGSCGGDWQVSRLRCVSCGNEDHRTQKYLHVDSRGETRRVEVCEQCKTYVKIISAFTPNSAEMLAVEDLATLDLDYIAQGQGYARLGSGQKFAYFTKNNAIA